MLALIWPLLETAGMSSFAVNPVRIDLSESHLVSAVRVTNQGPVDAVIQIESVSWSQNHGENIYTPTRELLVNPPIFNLPVGKSQIVRVGLIKALDSESEKAYRIFLQEVPNASDGEFTGLRVLLRIGVPVFFESPTASKPKLHWQVRIGKNPSQLRVIASNEGSKHVRISKLELFGSQHGSALVSRTLADTLLAGQSHEWLIDLTHQVAISPVEIRAETDSGRYHSGPIGLTLN